MLCSCFYFSSPQLQAVWREGAGRVWGVTEETFWVHQWPDENWLHHHYSAQGIHMLPTSASLYVLVNFFSFHLYSCLTLHWLLLLPFLIHYSHHDSNVWCLPLILFVSIRAALLTVWLMKSLPDCLMAPSSHQQPPGFQCNNLSMITCDMCVSSGRCTEVPANCPSRCWESVWCQTSQVFIDTFPSGLNLTFLKSH